MPHARVIRTLRASRSDRARTTEPLLLSLPGDGRLPFHPAPSLLSRRPGCLAGELVSVCARESPRPPPQAPEHCPPAGIPVTQAWETVGEPYPLRNGAVTIARALATALWGRICDNSLRTFKGAPSARRAFQPGREREKRAWQIAGEINARVARRKRPGQSRAARHRRCGSFRRALRAEALLRAGCRARPPR